MDPSDKDPKQPPSVKSSPSSAQPATSSQPTSPSSQAPQAPDATDPSTGETVIQPIHTVLSYGYSPFLQGGRFFRERERFSRTTPLEDATPSPTQSKAASAPITTSVPSSPIPSAAPPPPSSALSSALPFTLPSVLSSVFPSVLPSVLPSVPPPIAEAPPSSNAAAPRTGATSPSPPPPQETYLPDQHLMIRNAEDGKTPDGIDDGVKRTRLKAEIFRRELKRKQETAERERRNDKSLKVCRARFIAGCFGLPWLHFMNYLYYLEERDTVCFHARLYLDLSLIIGLVQSVLWVIWFCVFQVANSEVLDRLNILNNNGTTVGKLA